MYRKCPLCKCRDLIVLEQYSAFSEFLGEECGYTMFRCKECGYRFCIDEKYLSDETVELIESDTVAKAGGHGHERLL